VSTRLEVDPGAVGGAVAGRVAACMAARAGLGVERVEDARLAAAALGHHAGGAVRDGRLVLVLEPAAGALVMRAAPLDHGGGDRLLRDSAVPGLGPLIERLARTRVDAEGGGEALVVEIGGAAPAA
jgi:serine/threonine-protein kinase RsbW